MSHVPQFKSFTTFALRDPVSGMFISYVGNGTFLLTSALPDADTFSVYYIDPAVSGAIGVLTAASFNTRMFFASNGWSLYPTATRSYPNLVTPVSTPNGSLALWTSATYLAPPTASPGALSSSATPITWEYVPVSNAVWIVNDSATVVGVAAPATSTALRAVPMSTVSTTNAALPFEVCYAGYTQTNPGSGTWLLAALGSYSAAKSTVLAWCAPVPSSTPTTSWSAQLQQVQLLPNGVAPVAPSGMTILTPAFVSGTFVLQSSTIAPGISWNVTSVNLTTGVLTLQNSSAGQPALAWLRDTNFSRPASSFLAMRLAPSSVPFPMPAPTASSSLGTPAIIGIAVGSALVVLAIILGAVYGHRAAVKARRKTA